MSVTQAGLGCGDRQAAACHRITGQSCWNGPHAYASSWSPARPGSCHVGGYVHSRPPRPRLMLRWPAGEWLSVQVLYASTRSIPPRVLASRCGVAGQCGLRGCAGMTDGDGELPSLADTIAAVRRELGRCTQLPTGASSILRPPAGASAIRYRGVGDQPSGGDRTQPGHSQGPRG